MKTNKCVLVGYGELQGIKGYHVCDRDIRKCLVTPFLAPCYVF